MSYIILFYGAPALVMLIFPIYCSPNVSNGYTIGQREPLIIRNGSNITSISLKPPERPQSSWTLTGNTGDYNNSRDVQDSRLQKPSSKTRLKNSQASTGVQITTATDIDGSRECASEREAWNQLDYGVLDKYSYSSKVYTITSTYIYETLEGKGEGELYTACDGIPRFRFSSRPTSKSIRTVT